MDCNLTTYGTVPQYHPGAQSAIYHAASWSSNHVDHYCVRRRIKLCFSLPRFVGALSSTRCTVDRKSRRMCVNLIDLMLLS